MEAITSHRRTSGFNRDWLVETFGSPLSMGNHVDVLVNGREIFPSMLAAIACARESIDLASFNFGGAIGTEFASELAERARSGVDVRVLLDCVGARRKMDPAAVRILERAGARLEWFRPVRKTPVRARRRGHRKILVCDDVIGFTGGVGIDDRWSNTTTGNRRDTHFRVEGPAVTDLVRAFTANWEEATGRSERRDDRRHPLIGTSVVKVIASGNLASSPSVAAAVSSIIARSREHLRIATAYFVPTKSLLTDLCAAATRGVIVDLLVNGGAHSDKRVTQLASQSMYQPLIDAGVRIWEYQRSMLHAKMVTADGLIASVGSANLNGRSFLHDEELNLVILDEALVARLDRQFDADLDGSTLLNAERWARRNRVRRSAERTAGLLRRYL